MILRAPHAHEAAELTALVLRSKASWGYSAAFIEACREELTVRPEAWGTPQIAEDGAVLGYVELHEEGRAGRVGHLFIDPSAQRKGVGTALLRWANDRARVLGLKRLILESEPKAESFYLKAGFLTVGHVASSVDPERKLPVMERAIF
ncbi:MAG: GNAT family N-acetyltransferase [Pseudomonadota bacterium]